MTQPDRLVRHLRLAAPSADDLRHVLPVLEDALRCASLPDTGSRLLLVRRLALGRIARDADAQTLARLIEQRVQAAGGQWVDGGTPAAAGAACVQFAGALQARTQLAIRIARGVPHAEWYWPLAVPELRAAISPGDALRRIAATLAQWPEARRALPAWAAALVQRGATTALAAAIDAPTGEALLRQAGVPLLEVNLSRQPAQPRGLARVPTVPTQAPGQGNLPNWLRSLCMAAGSAPLAETAKQATEVAAKQAGKAPLSPHQQAVSEMQPAQGFGLATPAADAPPGISADAEPAYPAAHADVASVLLPASAAPRSAPPESADPRPPPFRPAQAPSGNAELSLPGIPSPWAAFDAVPSACAGLLFLLPVLVHLGLPAWLDEAPDSGFAQRVLNQALRRLRVPDDDPAWVLAAVAADAQAVHAPAPAGWEDPVLAQSYPHPNPLPLMRERGQKTAALTPSPASAGEGRGEGRGLRNTPHPPLAHTLAACTTANAQATVWLTAARRWLRRAGRIGLASLVLRPGFISLTPTHADLHFPLQATDLRVRRLGLDLDPGWLPWFGRVVAFHYQRVLP